MKITFIHHSSFLVETESLYLLFDYFKGALPSLDPAKPLYVLASHSHSDHYSRKIYSLADRAPAGRVPAGAAAMTPAPTTFLLGHDIDPRDIPPGLCEQTHILQPHEIFEDKLLKVETLRSTDEGVAFWCTAADGPAADERDGGSAMDELGCGSSAGRRKSVPSKRLISGYRSRQIYHAGDHSNWIWEGTAHNIGFVHMYHEELEHIAGRKADVAMLPLDPRLEKGFPADWYFSHFPLHRRADGWLHPRPGKPDGRNIGKPDIAGNRDNAHSSDNAAGRESVYGWALTIEEYMQYADAQVIFPMHQWGQFELTDRFRILPETSEYADRIVRIHNDGEQWEI